MMLTRRDIQIPFTFSSNGKISRGKSLDKFHSLDGFGNKTKILRFAETKPSFFEARVRGEKKLSLLPRVSYNENYYVLVEIKKTPLPPDRLAEPPQTTIKRQT